MQKRKKVFIRVLCVVLAFLLVGSLVFGILGTVSARAVSQSDIDSLESQQADLAQQQEEIQAKIDSLEYEELSALSKKEVLDQQIDLTQQEIKSVTDQIAAYDEMIVDKKAEVDQKRKEEQAQWELYEERIRIMEENGTVSYFEILFSATDFSDLLARIDFISEIMEYDEQMYQDLVSAREATAQAVADMESTQAALEDKKAELTTLQADLETQVADASKMISDIENNISDYEAEFQEIEEENARLQEEIDAKMAELKAQQEAAAAAAAAAAAEAEASGDSGDSSGEAAEGEYGTYTGGGAIGTGSFIWPSNDSTLVTSFYGTRLHPIYGYYRTHNGVDIGASYGSAILASDSGTVMTVDYDDGGYGNYIMLDHGNGRYTLYAHMSGFAVSLGETVSQGQTIGYVGSTGASTGPHIHFEIYIDYSRVNPLDFFSNYSVSSGAY